MLLITDDSPLGLTTAILTLDAAGERQLLAKSSIGRGLTSASNGGRGRSSYESFNAVRGPADAGR